MDRSTTHANEYRASELSRPVYGRATAESFRQQQQSQEHEAIAARSYQDSNAVNHAFLEFHKARMASNDRFVT